MLLPPIWLSRGNGVFVVETETAPLLLGVVEKSEAENKGRIDVETVGDEDAETDIVVETVGYSDAGSTVDLSGLLPSSDRVLNILLLTIPFCFPLELFSATIEI